MSCAPDPFYGDYDPEEGLCDSCSESFPVDDLRNHDDGCTYCQACSYETEQDRIDAEGDRLHDQFADEGWV